MSNFSGFIESKEDADRQIGAVAMKMPISRLGLFAMKMPICRLGLFTKKMPEASDNGSQPYRNAVRCFEMAGMGLPLIITACPWVGDMVSTCPLHISKVLCVGVALTSHFAAPKRGSCMASYLCLMPTAFFPLQHKAYAYHIPSPKPFHIDDCKSPTMRELIQLKRLANCPATINSGCIDPRMASRQ